jgi:hypothetical protein
MEPKISLSYSQGANIGPYPETDETCLTPVPLHFNIILPCMSIFFK